MMMSEDLPIASFTLPAGMRDLCIGEGSQASLEQRLDVQIFHIRLANSAGRSEAASLLIRKMYGWRGYAVDPNAAHETDKITLYAETGGVVVGTMSLCLDSKTNLPADQNFRAELDGLRKQGRRLCEPSRSAPKLSSAGSRLSLSRHKLIVPTTLPAVSAYKVILLAS